MPDTHTEHRSANTAAGNALARLAEHGQSCWLDDLSRRMILSGELAELVEQGVRGVTANPATFAKAIIGGADYDPVITGAAASGLDVAQTYERIVTSDVRDACDIFAAAYRAAGGLDGYVSLEVSPYLAHDTARSIAEAKRLWKAVGRPNLFIKIPGTIEGVPAIEECLFEGLNINITLLFSVERYEAVAEAYLKALERRAAAGLPLSGIASVASFFLSRIDVLVDQLLQKQAAAAAPLAGKAAVANAKLAYQSFMRLFAGPRWEALAAKGAQVQRLLWASTGTKNPAYPELMYVEPLIGRPTVNTMPLNTIKAFLDHGTVRDTVEEGVDEARRVMAELSRIGVDFAAVARRLEDEGVQKFIEPFDELMRHIAGKRAG
jgi:transaldolase